MSIKIIKLCSCTAHTAQTLHGYAYAATIAIGMLRSACSPFENTPIIIAAVVLLYAGTTVSATDCTSITECAPCMAKETIAHECEWCGVAKVCTAVGAGSSQPQSCIDENCATFSNYSGCSHSRRRKLLKRLARGTLPVTRRLAQSRRRSRSCTGGRSTGRAPSSRRSEDP